MNTEDTTAGQTKHTTLLHTPHALCTRFTPTIFKYHTCGVRKASFSECEIETMLKQTLGIDAHSFNTKQMKPLGALLTLNPVYYGLVTHS